MYDTISQVFLALFVIAHLAFLAALAWRASGRRLCSARENHFASVEREGRAMLGLRSRKEKNSLQESRQNQLQSIVFGPQMQGLVTTITGQARFPLNSGHEELWRHAGVESRGDTGSSLR